MQRHRRPSDPTPSSQVRLRAVVWLLLFVSACAIELPQAPYFETAITVPLGRERITGEDLADESEFLFADSTGEGPLRLFFEGRIDTFRIDEQLDIRLPDAEFSGSLDAIRLPQPDDVDEQFRLGELTDLPVPKEGTSIVVPPFSIPTIRRALPLQDAFFWVRLRSGEIDVRLQNLLPVPLGLNGSLGSTLIVRLVDPSRDETLLTAEFESAIPAGGIGALALDLAGVELRRRMELEIEGSSPGSLGDSVFVHPEQGFDLTVEFSDLDPDSATARVPAQTVLLEDTLDVDLRGDLDIIGGSVLEGRIPLALTNELPLAAAGILTFAELLEDGTPLAVSITLPPATSGSPGRFEGVVELASRTIRSRNGEPLDRLSYVLAVETEPSFGAVVLGRRQKVLGLLGESDLRFESVEARPNGVEVSIPRTETALDLPEELEHLELVEATLRIVLESTLPFPSLANAVLRGTGESDAVEIPISFGIDPGISGSPTESRFDLGPTNPDLLRLIHSRPATLAVEGAVAVGADGRTATVRRGDWVRGRYEVAAPLRVRLTTYEREADEFDFTISRDLQERIREDIVDVVAHGQVENRFPFAAETRLHFASSLERLESGPEVELEQIRVEPALVDPSSGRVIEPTVSSFEIGVPREEIPFFARDQIFGRLSFRLLGDSLSVVELSTQDFAEVTGVLEFRVGIGEESDR